MNPDFPILGAVLALGYLLLFQAAGLCAGFLLLPRESAGARLLLGSVFGSVLFHWLPALWAFPFGFGLIAHFMAGWTTLALGVLCLGLGRKWNRPGFRGAFSAFRRRKFLFVPLALTLFFGFLVWRGFLWENGRIYSSQATYGDMSMHLSFITSMARQGAFPPEYPLLPGHRLSYPFLGDSVSASLLALGAPLQFAYCLPMFLAGAQVFFGFYLFAARMTGHRGRAALAFLLFFGNGGFGFLYFLDGEKFARLFTAFYETPTNLTGENVRWVNVIVDMMLPQRATLFGWAVLFAALTLLVRAVFQGERRYFPLVGGLAGALPMIHTHSFLALGLVCAGWLLADLLKALDLGRPAVRTGKALVIFGLPGMALLQVLLRRLDGLDSPALLWFMLGAAGLFVLLLAVLLARVVRQARKTTSGSRTPPPRPGRDCPVKAFPASRRPGLRELALTWGLLLAVTLLLALPQLLAWTFRQAGEGHFLRGHFGWVIGEDEYLLFYLKNLGLAGLLALGGLLTAGGETFAKLCPALLIWFVAEFVEFQPNDYDNNKLLYAAFALLVCGAADFAFTLLEKLRQRGVRRTAAAAGLALCLTSAVLTWGREAVSRYELFGEGALELARYVDSSVPESAVVLTDTRHNNEIAALAGRTVVCGSPAYLYFHGLPYARNEQAARAMYETPEAAAEWFRWLNVDYVLVSDFERSSYAVDQDWFDAHGSRVYDDGVRILYNLDL